MRISDWSSDVCSSDLTVFLGPEESMRIQKVLDSDIVMIFDECPPVHVDGKPVGVDVVDRSMQLSLRWAERSKRAHEGNDAALFGIVQGGVPHDLRPRSADGLTQSADRSSVAYGKEECGRG